MAVVIELRRSQWAIFYGDPRDEAGYAELLSIASTVEPPAAVEPPRP